MSRDTSDTSSPEPTPDTLFAALGNESRIDILRVFATHAHEEHESGDVGEVTLGFSELWNRSTIEDSGRFNYHLDELLGLFVEKTGEGYRLSHRGQEVIGAIYRWAEPPEWEPPSEPIDVSGTCHDCGSDSLRASVSEEGGMRLACSACENLVTGATLPPGAYRDRSPDSVVKVFNRLMRANVLLATSDVCPRCFGPMQSGITKDIPQEWGFDLLPYFECTRCQESIWPTFGDVLVTNAAVRSFCFQHGLDPLSSPFWEAEFLVDDHIVSIDSTDPWQVTVELQATGSTLQATIDGDLMVTDIEIHSLPD